MTTEAGRARDRAGLAGVLLHGRGLAPEEMLGLAGRLGIRGCLWLAPAAVGGSWYPHRFTAPRASNEPFLSRAIEDCDQAVEALSDQGSGTGRVVLVGFSQGACLASEYILRRPGRCGAVVMFTGGLIGPPGTPWRLAPPATTLAGLQVLLTGSDVDEWVPEGRVRETAQVLAGLGADVRLRIYSGRSHLVSDDEILEARELISSLKVEP